MVEKSGTAVIVHGGAGRIPDHEVGNYRDGATRAAARARDSLQSGGSALDAAVAAVRVMEDTPIFNAGCGGALDAEGRLFFDASVMEGRGIRAGAIGAMPAVIRNPVDLARVVLERHPSVLLAGEGAVLIARREGFEMIEPGELITDRQRERYEKWLDESARNAGNKTSNPGAEIADTVGAVVRDESGWIVSALSTGGMRGKQPGRIGDSPLIGCGLYADDRLGGAASTGIGEHIIRSMLAGRAVLGLASTTSVQSAADGACAWMRERISGEAGLIMVDSMGRIAYAHTTKRLSVAWWLPGMDEPGAPPEMIPS